MFTINNTIGICIGMMFKVSPMLFNNNMNTKEDSVLILYTICLDFLRAMTTQRQAA